jgi:hypothetical protein
MDTLRRRPKLMRRLLPALLMWLGAAGSAAAQRQPVILIGAYVETNYSTQPGLQVSYASPSLLGGRSRFSISYSTTRLATAAGSSALVEDRLQAGAGVYFRQARTISPYAALNVGYTRFNREDEQLFQLLDNDAAILSLLAGAEVRLLPALRASGNVGYSALHSSTVYPFVAAIGLHHHLNRGARR